MFAKVSHLQKTHSLNSWLNLILSTDIRKIANDNKVHDAGVEVIVPRRIIKFFEKKYQSNKSMSYLCGVYLEEYLK